MSKEQKHSAGLDSLFVPIIEGITEIIHEKLGKGFELLTKQISTAPISNEKREVEYLKITASMIKNKQQTSYKMTMVFEN